MKDNIPSSLLVIEFAILTLSRSLLGRLGQLQFNTNVCVCVCVWGGGRLVEGFLDLKMCAHRLSVVVGCILSIQTSAVVIRHTQQCPVVDT